MGSPDQTYQEHFDSVKSVLLAADAWPLGTSNEEPLVERFRRELDALPLAVPPNEAEMLDRHKRAVLTTRLLGAMVLGRELNEIQVVAACRAGLEFLYDEGRRRGYS
jgi:hypothetical protein